MSGKMAIVLFSGTIDKLMAVGVLSSAAAALDMEVQIFATFWGLQSLRKDVAASNTRISKEWEEMKQPMLNIMKEKRVPSWLDLIKQAKSVGNVKIHACAMTFDLFGYKKEDLLDIVDDVVGAGEFLEYAKGADIVLFI